MKSEDVRNRSLDAFCRNASADQLVAECVALEYFRKSSKNLSCQKA